MFIEIAEAHPRFLRKQLPEVVGAMLQVGLIACVHPLYWLAVARVAALWVALCGQAAARRLLAPRCRQRMGVAAPPLTPELAG